MKNCLVVRSIIEWRGVSINLGSFVGEVIVEFRKCLLFVINVVVGDVVWSGLILDVFLVLIW